MIANRVRDSFTLDSSVQTPATSKIDAAGLIFLFLNLFLSGAGQMLLKYGLNHDGPSDGAVLLLSFWVNSYILVGVTIYAIGTIFWLLALCKLELSFAYPASSLQYILIFVAAWYFFGETVNWTRIFGLLFICIGVVAMSMEGDRS